MPLPASWAAVAAALLLPVAGASAWRSELYPEDWRADAYPDGVFATGKVLADFSHAGYRGQGESPPVIAGPVFDVVARGADPTGASDSTAAIQAAIDAAEAAGGGVVWMPEGQYRLSLASGRNEALRIDRPGVVLRGAGPDRTFLLNTSTSMRSRCVIRLEGPSGSGPHDSDTAGTPLRADVLRPTTRIPMTSVAGYAPGNLVVIRSNVTDAWVADHGNEATWLGNGSTLRGMSYIREVVAVETTGPDAPALVVDVPVRYELRTRDLARVRILPATPLRDVGLESFAIASVEQPGTGYGEDDYDVPGTVGYEVHGAWQVRFDRVRDGWMRDVVSWQPPGNVTTAHQPSCGVILNLSSRITLERVHFQRPQYGGGGGNGYMYRLQSSQDCLLRDCRATFSRHGFMLSHFASTGNVLLRCVDTRTGRATGATGAGYVTSGKGSDHHMHFSHANLVDACVADDSWFEARYRNAGSIPLHGLTAAHTVFWNVEGRGTESAAVVSTEQSRQGYAIGTRGARTAVGRPTGGGSKLDPPDHVEGVGQGDTLEPFSLYEDQLARRLRRPSVTLPGRVDLPFPASRVELVPTSMTVGGQPAAPGEVGIAWEADLPGVLLAGLPGGGVAADFGTARGTRLLRARLTGPTGATAVVAVEVVLAPSRGPDVRVIPSVADGTVRGGTYAAEAYPGATRLDLKQDANDSFDRQVHLRFPLAGLAPGTVESVVLELATAGLPAEHAQFTVEVATASPSWEEATLSWSTAPASTGRVATFVPDASRLDRVDVTAAALAARGVGATELGLRLAVLSQGGTGVLAYHAREAGASGPRLVATVARPDDTVGAWMAAAAPGLPAADRLPGADPDRDGVPNLLERLLGGDPLSPAGRGAWGPGSDGGLAVVLREPLPNGLTLALERSADLAAWTRRPLGTGDLEAVPGGTRVRLDADPSLPFVRLRAAVVE